MQRIELPVADERMPPQWRIVREGTSLGVEALPGAVTFDREVVEGAQHFVLDDDEIVIITIDGGDVRIDDVLYRDGDVLAVDDEEELRIVTSGGRANVLRLIEY